MSFSRGKIRRFNEVQAHSPPVGTYDPKFDGTIPYPKDGAAHSIRRDSSVGSTQSLWSLNSGRASSRSSCASVASERIATRFQSAGCLGVASAGRQRVSTGRDGGNDGGRSGWGRGATGRASSKAASEASVKGSVKAKGGDRGGVAREKPKDDVRAQAKDEANGEGSCEMRAKAKSLVGPETGGTFGGIPMNEATGTASNEAMIEVTDKAKCEDSRQVICKVDDKTFAQADAKAYCQAAGKSTAYCKVIYKHAPSLPRAVESEIDQPERLPNEPAQECHQERPSVLMNNRRLRNERRKFELNLLKSDWKRLTEGNGSPRKKQDLDPNSGQQERVLKRFPSESSGLLIDVVEHISRAEEEAQTLRTRVDELERENAELLQASISAERDFMDEVSWRKEELEKTEALVEKLREAKRRSKAELKKFQALVENLRMDYQKRTEELEKTFLLLKTLRLEHSKKTEKLEKSQSLAQNLQSTNLKISEALEKSQSLVATLSSENRTKTEELEGFRRAVRNLEFESSVKSTALENSRLTVENLQLENFRCKEALKNCQSYVDSLLVESWNSKFAQWYRNSSGNTFDPHKQTQNFRVKPRRLVSDEDCAMTEVDSNLSDRTFVLSDISGSRDSVSETQKSANVPQTDFKFVGKRRLLSELSDVQESPTRAPETSSKDRESCNERQSCQLRRSLSLGKTEPRKEIRQNLTGVKSEPILTTDLTAICNRIRFLSLDDNGTGSKTKERKFVKGNIVYRESENLKKFEECLGFVEFKSLREIPETLGYRKPESLEEIRETLENMELQTPQDAGLWLSEKVVRETLENREKKNSGECRESLIPELVHARIGEGNNQSSSVHNKQNNHFAQLALTESLLKEDSKDLDENHASSQSTGNAILGTAAGARKTARNCNEKEDCKNASARLQTFEGNESRRRAINSKKKKAEMKGSSNVDGNLDTLTHVFDKHLDKFRGRCLPKTSEPRRERFPERVLGQSKEKHGEFGEIFIKNKEKFGENGGKKFEKKLGEKFEKNEEEKHGEKVGDKREKKFGAEKFQDYFGEKLEEKFRGLSRAELTTDPTLDDYDSASQWKKRYEELWTVAQPFKDLLSAYDSQRQLLQGHRNAGQAEIEKLSHNFAKVLNHEHERQMVNQILRLREQNSTLKREMELLWVRKATTEVVRS